MVEGPYKCTILEYDLKRGLVDIAIEALGSNWVNRGGNRHS